MKNGYRGFISIRCLRQCGGSIENAQSKRVEDKGDEGTSSNATAFACQIWTIKEKEDIGVNQKSI